MTRKSYLSDVSDDERAFVAPYLTLMREDAPQRGHPLREVFNGLRYIVHTGMQWRMMPHNLPPCHAVYQQTQRWLKSGVFEDLVHDLRMLMREIDDRMQRPRAAILDGRARVDELAKQIQEVTGDSVEVVFVDQGYTGDKTAAAASLGRRTQLWLDGTLPTSGARP
jgi:transposase